MTPGYLVKNLMDKALELEKVANDKSPLYSVGKNVVIFGYNELDLARFYSIEGSALYIPSFNIKINNRQQFVGYLLDRDLDILEYAGLLLYGENRYTILNTGTENQALRLDGEPLSNVLYIAKQNYDLLQQFKSKLKININQ